MRIILALLVAAVLVPLADAEIREVNVTGGRVTGVAVNGIVSFKGIPFAAPPVGELRWKPPQPVQPWTGVKQANAYGPSCMQDPNFVKIFGAPPAISEDCLYLNIWTPAKTPGDKLPVMVWIYGGGFVGGMTSIPAYDGTRLAEKGVVLVSVAYRLGVFGFLADPELSRESSKGVSGNYGLEDQIAGLKWVKANIARFGGDPSRVTIFGESAGGMSVSMLTVSPAAKGLFQRAISESGGSLGPARFGNEGGETVPPLKVAEASGQKFLGKLGANDIQAARALSAEKIQTALGPGLQGGFWPVYDGYILPRDAYELYQARRFNDTPVLVGTNSDEGALFVRGGVTPAAFEAEIRAGYGKEADAVLAAYPHATGAEAAKSGKDIFRDATFAWHTWAWALLQSEKGRGKAYVYYFDHRTPQSPNGATHGAEIGYVFRNLGGPGGGPSSVAGTPRPDDVAMSDLMSSYWTNFAKNGDPNGSGLPEWPAFSAAHEQVMYLGAHSGAQDVPNMAQIKALDGYFAWRREQEKTELEH
ncbi:MAG TPA: carboxylesterase family protein [Bryobacteraceae bacterium]|nr:carboxylesterase family protein [Bryobacteraceae bacterium]